MWRCLETDSFLARPRRETFIVDFVAKGLVMVTCFGSVPFLPSAVGDLPEFAYLMSLNLSNCPRCLLWHGWLPGLSGIGDKDPVLSLFSVI